MMRCLIMIAIKAFNHIIIRCVTLFKPSQSCGALTNCLNDKRIVEFHKAILL